jgi:hypothetical protein
VNERFAPQRKLAQLLGVSPTDVERWRYASQAIDEVSSECVGLLELVMPRLLRLHSMEASERWLAGTNPHLRGSRPIDLITAGRTDELLDAIAQERAGSFG